MVVVVVVVCGPSLVFSFGPKLNNMANYRVSQRTLPTFYLGYNILQLNPMVLQRHLFESWHTKEIKEYSKSSDSQIEAEI